MESKYRFGADKRAHGTSPANIEVFRAKRKNDQKQSDGIKDS